MSQIRGAAQSERELAVRMANPSIDTYGIGTNPGESSYAALRPGRDANDPNSYTGNMAFGSYQRDSHAAQDMRNFYDTMDAVAARPDVAGGTPVHRVANITDTEMDLMRSFQDTEKTKKWESYWWSTADPSKPWTMNELNKIDPVLVQRKMDAIQELSQFSLDKAIIKHLGHNGNPRLAQLQYMMDQGQLDYMPQTVVVDNTPYTRGPLSLFQLAAGAQKSLDAESVVLPRQAFRPNAETLRANDNLRNIQRGSAMNPLELFNNRPAAAPAAAGGNRSQRASGSGAVSAMGQGGPRP
ncbi:hypothetical protein T492DRAFT_840019 [Pavlovales sp. CCMP2436]|nr:hypothetical protein T492DRAFT_840019 [Pavlovales sp. CCMP2436]